MPCPSHWPIPKGDRCNGASKATAYPRTNDADPVHVVSPRVLISACPPNYYWSRPRSRLCSHPQPAPRSGQCPFPLSRRILARDPYPAPRRGSLRNHVSAATGPQRTMTSAQDQPLLLAPPPRLGAATPHHVPRLAAKRSQPATLVTNAFEMLAQRIPRGMGQHAPSVVTRCPGCSDSVRRRRLASLDRRILRQNHQQVASFNEGAWRDQHFGHGHIAGAVDGGLHLHRFDR